MGTLTSAEWIVGKLKSDATLLSLAGGRVFLSVAPEKTTYPLVIVQPMSCESVLGVGAERIMMSELVLVRAVDLNTTAMVGASIIERVREVLHKASGSVQGGIVLGCAEERIIPPYVEVERGQVYRHIGVELRVYTQ